MIYAWGFCGIIFKSLIHQNCQNVQPDISPIGVVAKELRGWGGGGGVGGVERVHCPYCWSQADITF